MARYHGMMPGDIYTVIYEKRSKILISILSEEDEELWDVPFDKWLAENSEDILKRKKKENF